MSKTTAKVAAELADNPAMEEKVQQEIDNSRLVGVLVSSREAFGISPEKLAKFLGWEIKRIHQIESGNDSGITNAEASRYMYGVILTSLSVITEKKL